MCTLPLLLMHKMAGTTSTRRMETKVFGQGISSSRRLEVEASVMKRHRHPGRRVSLQTRRARYSHTQGHLAVYHARPNVLRVSILLSAVHQETALRKAPALSQSPRKPQIWVSAPRGCNHPKTSTDSYPRLRLATQPSLHPVCLQAVAAHLRLQSFPSLPALHTTHLPYKSTSHRSPARPRSTQPTSHLPLS